MNFCFICKYPPIQGGVSMHGYWAARGLAEKGHKVFVVTNANEVEPTFRIELSQEDVAAGGEYARSFSSSSGIVKVISTEPPDRKRLYYIPMNNPTVTRLATVATNLIRSEGCTAIFTYYFEPYGLAAYLASCWTGVPYVLKHAGSDLNRLMQLDDLYTAYLEVLLRANRVISRGVSRKQLLSYGVPASRINSEVAFGIPTDYFNPEAAPLDLDKLISRPSSNDTENSCSGFLNKSLAVLGVYGKLGEWKGSFDLLHAMAHLIDTGFEFYLLVMSHGWQEHHFMKLVNELKLTRYVHIIPFLPPWKVAGFIRSCTAIAFLERDFPIKAHTPTIPSEVIACGKCLILSGEVARKQFFRTEIRNHRNLVIVSDPKEHENLSSCLRFALEDHMRAEAIGARALSDFGTGHAHTSYINDLESLLVQVAREKPLARSSVDEPNEVKSKTDAFEAISDFFPYTNALLVDSDKDEIRTAISGSNLGADIEDRCELALQIGRVLLSLLSDSDPARALVSDVCRYEQKTYEWVGRKEAAKVNSNWGLNFSLDYLGTKYPILEGDTEVVSFSYDVEAICAAIDANEEIPSGEHPVRVLFHANSRPMIINEHTEYLLSLLADGQKTTEKVFRTAAGHYKGKAKISRKQLIESGLSALEGLYWEGIIEFGATKSNHNGRKTLLAAQG